MIKIKIAEKQMRNVFYNLINKMDKAKERILETKNMLIETS